MSNYHARIADAFKDRLEVVHSIISSPSNDKEKIELIDQLSEPSEIEDIKSRALEAER